MIEVLPQPGAQVSIESFNRADFLSAIVSPYHSARPFAGKDST